MKIVNRLVRIGRPERRFGGFGNRMMLENVCLWSTSHSVSIWLKNYENRQLIGPNRPTHRRFGPNSARIMLSKAYVD